MKCENCDDCTLGFPTCEWPEDPHCEGCGHCIVFHLHGKERMEMLCEVIAARRARRESAR